VVTSARRPGWRRKQRPSWRCWVAITAGRGLDAAITGWGWTPRAAELGAGAPRFGAAAWIRCAQGTVAA